MEDWTRVVLYGTYDGFVRSIVDSLQIAVRLDSGERVEIPSECVISADQIVKKDEIKLRDVIKRIKDLDIGAREVWLNEILNELGSDYGTLKYKDGYEQGKVEGLIECEKPVVPQSVANWIEYCKNTNVTMTRALLVGEVDFYNYANQEDFSKLKEFLETENNQELFARAWLDGYTVEEKRYYIRLKNIDENYNYLTCIKHLNAWALTEIKRDKKFRTEHTKKQLEDGGFGWVLDCPGIEIEEVEG